MSKKIKKSLKQNKLSKVLKSRQAIFVLVFALLGVGLMLVTHAGTPYNNPASKTYNVTLPPAECIHTKSGGCSPIPHTAGLKLYGPANKRASYVLHNVGPGRYNLDFTYSIPQVVGIYDYGHINYAATGKIVNIGQPTTGSRHVALYGSSPSTSTAPLSATETFTSFGVKWPGSDVRITVNYTNSAATTLRMTAIQLRPQKSRSGWTCGAASTNCSPSADYKYYFSPSAGPSTASVSGQPSSSQAPSHSSSAVPTGSSSASSAQQHNTSAQAQKTEFKKSGEKQSSYPKLDSSQEEATDCSQGNVFRQTYCQVRSALDSLFSRF